MNKSSFDLKQLRAGHVKLSYGDIRCITYGHLIRLAIWSLRLDWNKKEPTASRIAKVADWIKNFGGWKEVGEHLPTNETSSFTEDMPLFAARESAVEYGAEYADIPF